tara:strand:+ start:21 stop:212 length:192 start_codon:yes stop_codon:yes gene_type:complete
MMKVQVAMSAYGPVVCDEFVGFFVEFGPQGLYKLDLKLELNAASSTFLFFPGFFFLDFDIVKN